VHGLTSFVGWTYQDSRVMPGLRTSVTKIEKLVIQEKCSAKSMVSALR
jgi:hypothetical protein